MTEEECLDQLREDIKSGEFQRRMAQFHQDSILLDTAEVYEKYNNQFVAAYFGKIVAVSTDLNDIINQLDAQYLPRGEVALTFVTHEPINTWTYRNS
jgi:hypothetical protein